MGVYVWEVKGDCAMVPCQGPTPESNGTDALGLSDAPPAEVIAHPHGQGLAHTVEELQGGPTQKNGISQVVVGRASG